MSARGPATEYDVGPGLVLSLWRGRVVIVLVAVMAGLLAYAATSMQPTVWSAVARVVLAPDDLPRADAEHAVAHEARRLRSLPVLRVAAADLGVDATALRGTIDVTADVAAGVLRVRASAADPQRAARTADAVVDAYQTLVVQARDERLAAATRSFASLRTDVRTRVERLLQASDAVAGAAATLQLQQTLARALSDLREREDRLTIEATLEAAGIEFIETAEPPTAPSAPRPRRNAALAGLLGAALASAAVWRRGAVDDRPASRVAQVSATLEAPRLGVTRPVRTRLLGRRRAMAAPVFVGGRRARGPNPLATRSARETDEPPSGRRLAPGGGVRSAQRRRSGRTSSRSRRWRRDVPVVVATAGDLRENAAGELSALTMLEVVLADRSRPVIAVVSASERGDGAAAVVNLAAVAGASGRDVVVVDGDRERAAVTRLLGLAGAPGFADLADRPWSAAEQWMHKVRLGAGVVRAVPVGYPESGDPTRRGAEALRRAVERLGEDADLVLFHVTDGLRASDAVRLAGLTDGLVVIAPADTPVDELAALRQRLQVTGVPVLGWLDVSARSARPGVTTPA